MKDTEFMTSVRFGQTMIDRLDALADKVSATSKAKPNRSAAMRMAIEKGLEILEQELRVTEKGRK